MLIELNDTVTFKNGGTDMCIEDKKIFLDKIVCTYMYKTVFLMYVSSNKIAHKFNRWVKSIILSCRPRDEEDRI